MVKMIEEVEPASSISEIYKRKKIYNAIGMKYLINIELIFITFSFLISIYLPFLLDIK